MEVGRDEDFGVGSSSADVDACADDVFRIAKYSFWKSCATTEASHLTCSDVNIDVVATIADEFCFFY